MPHGSTQHPVRLQMWPAAPPVQAPVNTNTNWIHCLELDWLTLWIWFNC